MLLLPSLLPPTDRTPFQAHCSQPPSQPTESTSAAHVHFSPHSDAVRTDLYDHSSAHNATNAPTRTSFDMAISDLAKENAFAPPKDAFGVFRDKMKSDDLDLVKGGVRFVNKPNGTPLFTIMERQSSATLRSKGSSLTFALGPLKPISSAQSQLQLILRKADGARSASADDVAFGQLQKAQDALNAQTAVRQSDKSSEAHALIQHAAPLEPSFQPPERIPTPEGVARWPHDSVNPTFDNRAIANPTPKKVRLRLARLRSKVSRLFGDPGPPEPPVRPWRAAPSGHYTFRYSDLDSHPFTDAPLAQVVCPTSRTWPNRAAVRTKTPQHQRSVGRRSLSEASTSTAAIMALREAQSSAVPIRLDRVVSPGTPRSARMPQLKKGMGQAYEAHYASDTMRTADLIEQFPSPPTRSSNGSAAASVADVRLENPIPLARNLPMTRSPLLTFPGSSDWIPEQSRDHASARNDSACYSQEGEHTADMPPVASEELQHPPPQLPPTPRRSELCMSGGLPNSQELDARHSGHSRELSQLVYSTHTSWTELCPHLLAKAQRHADLQSTSQQRKPALLSRDENGIRILGARILPVKRGRKKDQCLKCRGETKVKHGVGVVAKGLASMYQAAVNMP